MVLLVSTRLCTADEELPILKEVFKNDFLIGGALNGRVVAGRDPQAAEIAIKHYNTATAENEMKWQRIHPRIDEYNWEPADRFVEFCETNQMAVIGHTLVWHSQVPRWVFQDDGGNDLTRDALLARMEHHIKTVVGRYKGRIKGWDVVNEALEGDGSMRDTKWLQIIGEGSEEQKYDFIEHAFRWAHEADPNAELYYNDYNLESSNAKCDGAVAIVKYLQSRGIRIDGVGIQLHGGLEYPSMDDFEYAITNIAATGVKVMVTELDIRTQRRGYRGADISRINRQSTDDPEANEKETQKKVAEKYKEIFTVLLKHKNDISRVTFWGIYDGASWIGGSPLLFDRDYQPKEAFYAVVKSAQVPVIHPEERNDPNSKTAHQQLLEKTKQGVIDIYFEGDSITRRWGALDYPDLLEHWKKNFHGWNAANFAWGGDRVQNILWRLQNGELENVHPKVFVLQAGTNNIGSRRPTTGDDDPRIAEVFEGMKSIVSLFQEKFPDATIIITGIFPRNDNRENPTGVMPIINSINENTAKLADGKAVRYININNKLADETGMLYDGMTMDNLHLAEQGYQIWADALKPIFTEILGPPADLDQAPPPTGDPSAAR
jgi:GH35 family endo-1,4-beta-xylanase/lysophospholipase L1-like esterase